MDHSKYQTCFDSCVACVAECMQCASEDLKEKDVKMLVRCIKLNHDCADFCLVAMKAMASGSEFAQEICKLCAEVCNACASECEKHSHMKHCKKCAEACRKCSTVCLAMSKG